MIRLLETLKPRSAGSICLPFFPFFFPPRPPSEPSDESATFITSVSGRTGFFSTSINDVSDTPASLYDDVLLNRISFLPNVCVSLVEFAVTFPEDRLPFSASYTVKPFRSSTEDQNQEYIQITELLVPSVVVTPVEIFCLRCGAGVESELIFWEERACGKDDCFCRSLSCPFLKMVVTLPTKDNTY